MPTEIIENGRIDLDVKDWPSGDVVEPLTLQYDGDAVVNITNDDNLSQSNQIFITRSNDAGTTTFNIGDNAKVAIGGDRGSSALDLQDRTYNFNLGDGAELDLKAVLGETFRDPMDPLDYDPVNNPDITMPTKDETSIRPTINIDMGEGHNSTLVLPDYSEQNVQINIFGLSPGDQIISPWTETTSGYIENDAGHIEPGADKHLTLDVFSYATGSRSMYDLNIGDASSNDFSVLNIEPDQGGGISLTYACYLKGTHILTPEGEVKVETLESGDRVLTASGGVAIVKWLGYRTLYKSKIPEKDRKRAFPILFKKGCISDNVPHRDLVISPGHHVYFDGNLVPAMMLVNGKSIVQQFQMQSFQYFHVELEQFDILLAEGVPAESYVDTGNRNMFQNAHEVAMNPDFGPAAGRPDVPGITVARKGPIVEAIKAKLLERTNWMQMPNLQKRSA
jgi:hypothetical protein